MKKPLRKTKDMILCVECKSPIHIDDLGLMSKEGLYHKECSFKIVYQDQKGFIFGFEGRVKEKGE